MTDRHASSAAPTQHQTLQQRHPVARRTASFLGEVVHVVVQLLAVAEILIVAQIRRVDVRHDDVPLLDRPAPFGHDRRIARGHLQLAASIDEHAGIDRAGEHLLDHLIGGLHPHELARVGAELDEARHLQPLRVELTLHGAGVTQHREPLKDPGQRLTDLLLGIEDDRPITKPAVADREAEGQFATTSLVQEVAAHAGPKDMQLGGEQGSLDPEQQAVVGILRIIDAVLVRNESAEDGTQLDHPVPVAVATRQARHLGDQHHPDLAQADRRDQALEAGALMAAGS